MLCSLDFDVYLDGTLKKKDKLNNAKQLLYATEGKGYAQPLSTLTSREKQCHSLQGKTYNVNKGMN